MNKYQTYYHRLVHDGYNSDEKPLFTKADIASGFLTVAMIFLLVCVLEIFS